MEIQQHAWLFWDSIYNRKISKMGKMMTFFLKMETFFQKILFSAVLNIFSFVSQWNDGPTNAPTGTDDKYFFDIDNLLDEYRPRIMPVEEMREFREAILKAEIRDKLLERESEELDPPKWQFDFKRGLFDISFKT